MDVKAAVGKAIQSCSELFERQIADVRLEEVEKGGENWRVTLSFVRTGGSPVTPQGLVATALAQNRPREYKVFSINDETGELLAVRMREE